MRQRKYLFICLLLLMSLGGCSPGHTGENIIAFVRDGQLWTIDPDGANAFALVSGGEPVVGYSWSPDHRLLAFRQLDKTFAATRMGKRLSGQGVTGQIVDIPSTLNTFGVDGGTPISIALSSPDVRYSNPFWIPDGTRLLYRQETLSEPKTPEEVTWWVSQSDQPAGIAAKSLPPLLSLPAVDDGNQRIVGTSHQGMLTTTLTGEEPRLLLPMADQAALSASVQRTLWQPGQGENAVLYATGVDGQKAGGQIELRLWQQDGTTKAVVNCVCEQFAWSPDGKNIVYQEGNAFSVYQLKDGRTYKVEAEANSVPYWSPDSRFLVLDGPHQLQFIEPGKQQSRTILSDGRSSELGGEELAPSNALLQPVSNSIWGSNSRQFLFVTRQRLQWEGKHIAEGLYSIGLGENGQVQGEPTLVSSGKISQAGWTYQDPKSSFLY